MLMASLEGRRPGIPLPVVLRGSPLSRLAPQDDGLSYFFSITFTPPMYFFSTSGTAIEPPSC